MDCNYEKIYEQYWLHARHAETQRWNFVAITMIITGGLLAILKLNENAIFIFPLLSAFYALGILVLISLRTPFIIFSRLTEIIALNELKMNRKYARFFPQNNLILEKKKKENNYFYWPKKKFSLNSILNLLYIFFSSYFFFETLILKLSNPIYTTILTLFYLVSLSTIVYKFDQADKKRENELSKLIQQS